MLYNIHMKFINMLSLSRTLNHYLFINSNASVISTKEHLCRATTMRRDSNPQMDKALKSAFHFPQFISGSGPLLQTPLHPQIISVVQLCGHGTVYVHLDTCSVRSDLDPVSQNLLVVHGKTFQRHHRRSTILNISIRFFSV